MRWVSRHPFLLHIKTPDFIQYLDFSDDQIRSPKVIHSGSHSSCRENWPSIYQLLKGSFSSSCHDPLCSVTHGKTNTCISSHFLWLLSCPILYCSLERDWFLSPWSCHKEMNYSLLCQNSFHHPQFYSIFFIEYLSYAKFCAWYLGEGKESPRVRAPRLTWGSGIVQLQTAWYVKDTGDRKGRDHFKKLSWVFLGDIQ